MNNLLRNKSLWGLILVALVIVAQVTSAEAAGRKYGLFIGINNYQGTPLKGAVNDARNLRRLMTSSFGFAPANTRLLLDGAATRTAIINGIRWYSTRVSAGDLFVVSYSGHGTLFPDRYSEDIEETRDIFVDLWIGEDHLVVPKGRYDSAICPIDSDDDTSGKPWDNLILDDELYALFADFVAKGAKVVFISDSCHSGTISRGAKGDVDARPRFMSPNRIFGGKTFGDIRFREPGFQRKVSSVTMNGTYLALSGSQDNEVSWDASIGGVSQGLFTNTLVKMIKDRGQTAKSLSYSGLMNLVSGAVAQQTQADFPTKQTPQISLVFGSSSDKIFQ